MFETGNSNSNRGSTFQVLVLITCVMWFILVPGLHLLSAPGSGLNHSLADAHSLFDVAEEVMVFAFFALIAISQFTAKIISIQQPVHSMVASPRFPPPKVN